MVAQDVLLGRLRIGYRSAEIALAEGGAIPRAVLTVLLVLVLAFEASTKDPLIAIGTYLYRGLGSWSAIPVIVTPLELLLTGGVILSLMLSALGPPTPSRPLRWPMVAFGAALAVGFLR